MQLLPVLVAILLGGCALIFVLYPIYEWMRPSLNDGQGKRTRQDIGSGQGEAIQGDRTTTRGRPYPPRNATNEHSIIGAGLASALDGTFGLRKVPKSEEHTSELQ